MTADPRDLTPEQLDRLCWSHYEVEGDDDTWMRCFECNHAYQTRADLEADYINEAPDEIQPHKQADDIYFCPHCLHDF